MHTSATSIIKQAMNSAHLYDRPSRLKCGIVICVEGPKSQRKEALPTAYSFLERPDSYFHVCTWFN